MVVKKRAEPTASNEDGAWQKVEEDLQDVDSRGYQLQHPTPRTDRQAYRPEFKNYQLTRQNQRGDLARFDDRRAVNPPAYFDRPGKRRDVDERGYNLRGSRYMVERGGRHGAEGEDPIGVRGETMMTVREQTTFEKLFKGLQRRGEARDGNDGERDLATRIQEGKDADEARELDLEDIADEQPMTSSESEDPTSATGAYPESLRGMAQQTQSQMQARKARRRIAANPYIREADRIFAPIRDKMREATTDHGVWEILDQELFSKVRSLDIDSTQVLPADTSQDSTVLTDKGRNKALALSDKKESSNLQVFALAFQRSVLVASKILCRRMVYTPLAFALLPTLKSLGSGAYVMGASSGLFNNILVTQWRVYNAFAPVLSLLAEMDRITCPMNEQTLAALEEMTQYRSNAERGMYGEALRQLELSPERKREITEIWRWKSRIQDRLREAESERLRRQEQEKALRIEGALGDEEDAVSGSPS